MVPSHREDLCTRMKTVNFSLSPNNQNQNQNQNNNNNWPNLNRNNNNRGPQLRMMDWPDSQDTWKTENFENLDNLQVMQINFNNPTLYQSANTDYKYTNKSNYLSYLFSYKIFEGFALIDTGASQIFINTVFIK